MNIVFASNNCHKLLELNNLLTNHKIKIQSQQELGIPEIPETGLTFIENALLKARNACMHANMPAIADDSGLAVDCLDGVPGIYSARYAGPHASDQDNITKLLSALAKCPAAQYQARYHCVLAYLTSATDPAPIICHGVLEGTIITTPRGTGGFGYDPIFWLNEYQCTVAELSLTQKNTISHRAQALKQLAQLLAS